MKFKIHEYQKSNLKIVIKNLLILLLTTFTLSSCNKDNDKPLTELEKLPAATQTGANKVGCLLDGVAFLPDNSPNSTNCFYQFDNGEYYFYLSALNYIGNNDLVTIAIKTVKKQIFENQQYELIENLDGNASGTFFINLEVNSTSMNNTGKLIITKLTPQIVSGTFWFDVKDNNGIIHQIREGRFDMQYTN